MPGAPTSAAGVASALAPWLEAARIWMIAIAAQSAVNSRYVPDQSHACVCSPSARSKVSG
jgi:hypothetical protein